MLITSNDFVLSTDLGAVSPIVSTLPTLSLQFTYYAPVLLTHQARNATITVSCSLGPLVPFIIAIIPVSSTAHSVLSCQNLHIAPSATVLCTITARTDNAMPTTATWQQFNVVPDVGHISLPSPASGSAAAFTFTYTAPAELNSYSRAISIAAQMQSGAHLIGSPLSLILQSTSVSTTSEVACDVQHTVPGIPITCTITVTTNQGDSVRALPADFKVSASLGSVTPVTVAAIGRLQFNYVAPYSVQSQDTLTDTVVVTVASSSELAAQLPIRIEPGQ